jgi:hypothetical protein
MRRVGFEPTTPFFERAKTIYALDLAATVIGLASISSINLLGQQMQPSTLQYNSLIPVLNRSGSGYVLRY